MSLTPRASAHLDSLRRLARRPPPRAAAIYLAVSPATAVLATVVGSTSEYRFPHPLVATLLHLALALVALTAASLATRALRHRRARRPAPPQPPSLVSHALDSLAFLLPPASLRPPTFPSSCALLAALSSALCALAELRAYRSLDPAVISAVRLAPLVLGPLVALAPLPPSVVPQSLKRARRAEASVVLACALVLGAGSGVALEVGWETGVVALAWTAGALGWVLCLSGARGRAEDEEEVEEDELRGRPRPSSRPSLLTHLLLSLVLLSIPTLLSTELANIRRSRHHTFFLEPGFWARESAVALLSLIGLSAFWHLASTLDPLPTLALVALKDRLVLPRAYHALLGNPLDALERGRALLGERQQVGLLVLVGGWAVGRAVRAEGADGRGAARRGRRKER